MGNKWIIDVLADLNAYAAMNGLPLLADEIDKAVIVAHAEIAATSTSGSGPVTNDGNQFRHISAQAGGSRPV